MARQDRLTAGETGFKALSNRLPGFLRGRGIGAKLGIGFGALIALTLAFGLVSLITDRLKQQAFEQLQTANKAALQAERMKVALSEARRLEQDFRIRYPIEGFEAALERYVIPNRQLTRSIQEQVAESKELVETEFSADSSHQEHLENLEFVEAAIGEYGRLFAEVVDKIEERGFKDTGLEGRYNQAAHKVETSVAVQYEMELQVTLLQMRRHEKDWILRREPEDIELAHNFGLQLKNQLNSLEHLAGPSKADLSDTVDDYLAAFERAAALDQEIADTVDQFRAIALSIAPIVDKIVIEQEKLAAAAQTSFDKAESLALTINLFLFTIITAAGIGLAVVSTRAIAGSITHLADVARQIAAGDLTAQASIKSGDELGQLAVTFNEMTTQLRDLVDTLEDRMADRTRRLETVMQVSQRLSGILDLSDLMREVVQRTKVTFDYYHVHIYLLDESGERLLMAEGYGQAGEEMRRQGHSIPLAAPKSLVARAAREGRVIVVDNVQEDPDWLPNPLLPDTRSEIAVPMMLGAQEVVGVLDAQSDQIKGLGEQDEATLQVLANQVATAVRNARLFSETQDALYAAQQLQQLYTGQAWERFGDTRSTTDYEFRRSELPPLQETPLPEAVAALQQRQTVDLSWPASDLSLANGDGQSELQNPKAKIQRALATPLRLRDQTIGVLGIHTDDPKRQWSQDEIALVEAVSEQMSLAIENARLFEETGRRASRERVIAGVTQQVWASGELELVMKTAVEQLGTQLDASRVVIRLGTEEELLSGTAAAVETKKDKDGAPSGDGVSIRRSP
jgi:GAF domain-containing protein/HAMP domain-containing protein